MQFDISCAGKVALLVEDEASVAETLSAQLRFLGIGEVLHAATLEEACDILGAEPVDIALLDVGLERGQTTIELGRILAAEGIPVIFTASFTPEHVARATLGHVFMEKPVSLPRLKAALHRAMLRVPALAPAEPRKKMAGPEARQ